MNEKNTKSQALFMFFHSHACYTKLRKTPHDPLIIPYALKFQLPDHSWSFIRGHIPNFQYMWAKKAEAEKIAKDASMTVIKPPKEYDLMGAIDFDTVPKTYLSICYDLDRSDPSLSTLRRIDLRPEELF